MTYRPALALLVIALLSGCASLSEKNAEWAERRAERAQQLEVDRAAARAAETRRQQAFRDTRPRCTSEAECEAMWNAAELWIADNAGMRLATATSNVLETFASTSPRLAVRATRRAQGDGEYLIEVSVSCGNYVFGTPNCSRSPHSAAMDFNRTVQRAGR